MSRNINLTEIHKGKLYQVAGFEQTGTAYIDKLNKMGFIEGTPLQLAPVELTDPLVVQIRGSRIALRRAEAKQVYVEELDHA